MQFPVLLRSERTNMRVTPIPARQRFLSFFSRFGNKPLFWTVPSEIYGQKAQKSILSFL